MDDEPRMVPFTFTVSKIKKKIEELLGINEHKLFNHVLVQKYRSGADFIGEHADKTLDVGHGTVIVNYSMGSERTLSLRSKDKTKDGTYEIQHIPLPNDSVFVMSLSLNRKMKHSIHRQSQESGERISLTFRRIETFYDKNKRILIGQGAPPSDSNDFQRTEEMVEEEKIELLKAFKEENSNSQFDWKEWYGKGFSVSFVDYDDESIVSKMK